MSDNEFGAVCEHGYVRRYCTICDLTEQLAAMRRERDEWMARAEHATGYRLHVCRDIGQSGTARSAEKEKE